MNNLKYKDYIGSIEYDEDSNLLYGKVLGLNRVLISYEGTNINELKADFIAGIEDYLNSCKENGEKPQKSYSGTFNVRLTPQIHARIAELAQQAGVSLNTFIKETLQKAIM